MPRSRPRPPPEFLVDRSLGAFEVPDAVRALGYVVYRLRDLYPDDAQHADDVVWIAEAGRRSLAVLTCDGRIRTTAHELAAVEAAGVKVFHVPAGQSASESIRLYTNNINRIVQRCARSGPAWYAVRQNSLDLMWEPAGH